MKPRFYEKDAVIYNPETRTQELLLIEYGVIEIFTYFEGNEFILERLYRGTVLNHRNIFMEDNNYVYAKCRTDVNILCLHLDKLNELKMKLTSAEIKRQTASLFVAE